MKRTHERILPLLALALLLPATPVLSQDTAQVDVSASQADPIWPFEDSDIPLDPDYVFGRLDNGMRYILRHNATPKGTGMVQLMVDAGSSSETESERGYAHFVEHMAFNGSTNVPEGEMIKLLEREGLAFGADTNASTGFEQTIYKLDLPRNDVDLLDTALMLMRETASELLFLPEAVQRERGVVMSEQRVRDTYSLRNFVDQLDFLYPGSRLSQRLPIGTVPSLKQADAEGLRGFWERNYVPGNTTLIVVGDFDMEQVEAMIEDHFGRWQGPSAPHKPSLGPVDPELAGLTDIHTDPALSEQVTISRNAAWTDRPDTILNRRRQLLGQIAVNIINRRFATIARGDNPPFRNAGFGQSEMKDTGRTTNLVVNTADGEWREGLQAAVHAYRLALQYGFSEAEIAEQLANYRTSLENAVAGADTRSNGAFVNSALGVVTDGNIPSTPASVLERFENSIPFITPESVHAALLEDYAALEDPLIRFEGSTAPEGGEAALRAVWEDAKATELAAPEMTSQAEFGYTSFGEPGTVVADTTEPEFGIREIRFANGLMLNLKKTDLQQDRITVRLNIDGGDMLDTRDNPLATAMAGNLASGGLGKHSLDELQTILAGRSVGFSVNSAPDSFSMGGNTTPRDLELQLQLLAAAVSDPGYRPQGEVQFRRSVAAYFARKDATPGSAYSSAIGGILSDNDPRFTQQPQEAYDDVSFAQLRDNIQERLANGAMELAIVGDFDEQQAIDLVARTLGALPARETEFRQYPENRQRSFTADRSPRVIYHDGQPNQAAIRLIWPTRDDSDPLENTQLNLLGEVAQLIATDILREELGQTYSPRVSASQSHTWPGWGTFSIGAEIDTADVPDAEAAIKRVVETMRSGGIDEDLLQRARQPVLESIENRLKTNGGWIALVEQAQGEAERIERFATARERVLSIGTEDLHQLALRYLDPAEALEVRVLPRSSDTAN